MYGTVARLRVQPVGGEKLLRISRDYESMTIPGFVFQHVYQLDADASEYILVVGFTDKAAYVKNADSPEQNERYVTFRALLAADPEWHDGEIVDSYPRST